MTMKMYFCPLFSGSSGNALFCQYGGTRILIDAGKTGRQVGDALRSIGAEPETLAGILVGVGIAIPLMFFGLYFLQVKAQVAERKLKDRPGVYTIHLREDGVSIVNDQHAEDPIDLPWPSLAAAYRVPGCIYLYVNSEHAFLLPDGQANVSQDAVWECLNNNLGVNRCFSRPAGPRARTHKLPPT